MTKVMVVDDEEDIRSLLKKILESNGYEVILAQSGVQCLAMLEDGERPDLILLDVMMPDLDGWETSKKIKANKDLRDIKVAMLTVKAGDTDKIKSYGEASANWHVSKPIENDKLLRTVKWLLS